MGMAMTYFTKNMQVTVKLDDANPQPATVVYAQGAFVTVKLANGFEARARRENVKEA